MDLARLQELCNLLLATACNELRKSIPDEREIELKEKTIPRGESLEMVRMAVEMSIELIRLEVARIQSDVSLHQVRP